MAAARGPTITIVTLTTCGQALFLRQAITGLFKLISSNLTTSDVCDGAGKCVAGGGFSVRCVLVLIPADVCSSASGEQVLLTVPRSAAVLAAAARALTIPTATRTPFGLIQRQT